MPKVESEHVANAFSLLGKLMELHDENPFKIRAIQNAAFKVEKLSEEVLASPVSLLEQQEGIGKGIAAKIVEYRETGSLRELESFLAKTPPGILDILTVKGLGPKKVATLWHELQVETLGELLYACKENRLVELKGFGEKTQSGILKSLEFKLNASGKRHYAYVVEEAEAWRLKLQKMLKTQKVEFTGELRRKSEVISKLEFIALGGHALQGEDLKTDSGLPLVIHSANHQNFYTEWFKTTATQAHLELVGKEIPAEEVFASEKEIYDYMHWPYMEPEWREGLVEERIQRFGAAYPLLLTSDLKGSLHNHTNYSDGKHGVSEMAEFCQAQGWEYLGLCDHSQSAFYAGGLKPERVMQQWTEIDQWNAKHPDFKILKGIESDILSDGSLDYEEELLKGFDFIVASVHQQLKMEKDRATQRLIKAIENPYTKILGHPTGRLLLARPGYPIDHKKVIDACAANGVAVELNAHPYRLDIDWKWIPYCMDKGVMIAINPDAHEKNGLLDMKWGVTVANKGALLSSFCLNALSLTELEHWFKTGKKP